VSALLASIVEAHGGLDRWRSFNPVHATIVTGGAFWGIKNLTQDQNPRRITDSLHEERASVAPFGDPDWHAEFTPDRIAILRSAGVHTDPAASGLPATSARLRTPAIVAGPAGRPTPYCARSASPRWSSPFAPRPPCRR
jgi:hypothetical protein